MNKGLGIWLELDCPVILSKSWVVVRLISNSVLLKVQSSLEATRLPELRGLSIVYVVRAVKKLSGENDMIMTIFWRGFNLVQLKCEMRKNDNVNFFLCVMNRDHWLLRYALHEGNGKCMPRTGSGPQPGQKELATKNLKVEVTLNLRSSAATSWLIANRHKLPKRSTDTGFELLVSSVTRA